MKGSFFVVLSNTFLFTFFTSCTNVQRNGNNGCGGTDWSADDHQCYRCMPDAVYWQTARSSCQRLGADLVTINNAGTQNFIENLCPDGVYWIGLNDISNEGTFLWVSTSTQFSYSNWNPGEPNDSGGEDCVHLLESTHKWNDINCARNHSYICQKDLDECFSSPCVHGVCTNHLYSYTCDCQPGYTGANCETDVNECQSSPCIHGNCSDLVNEYRCQCFPGYEGFQCQIDIDECQSSPCIQGNCSDIVNEYRCQCFPGFEGLQCQIDIDECLSSPCQQGTCIDKINSYMCHCSPGYTGVHCETDINECLSSPCGGHGSCIDKVNSFVCECTFGYKGISCDEFNTLLLLVLLTFLPIIMLIFSFYLSKRLKHNKVEDVAIFVFPDILRGESKPKLVFQK